MIPSIRPAPGAARLAMRVLVLLGWLVLPAIFAASGVEASPPSGGGGSVAGPVDGGSGLAGCLPDDLIAVAVYREGDRRVEAFRSFVDERKIRESAFYRTVSGQPGFARLQMGVLGIAAAAETDPWSGAAALAGRELIVGLRPGGGSGPQWIAASRARNPEVVAAIVAAVHRIAGLEKGGEPDAARSRVIEGTRVFRFSPELFECRVGDAWIVSNNAELIRSALVKGASGKGTLAGSAEYRRARQAAGDSAGFAYLDLGVLRAALSGQGRWPEYLSQPLLGLLLGGWWSHIAGADRVLVTLDDRDGRLRATVSAASTDPLPAMHQAFMGNAGDRNGWSGQALPRFLGELSVTRDWADLLARREAIFSLPAAGRIDEFAGVMTTLLGGLDFIDEVLPRVRGPVHLVVAGRDPLATRFRTTPTLPAFALVATIDPGEDSVFGRRLETGALMALGFLNFQAARKGSPAFLLDVEEYRGQRIYQADHPDPANDVREGDTPLLGVRYNFSPSVSFTGDRLVIGTTARVVREVLDSFGSADPAASSGGDRLTIAVPRLRAALEENRTELVVRRMIDEGESKAKAEAFFDALFGLLGLVREVSVASSITDSSASAVIEMTFEVGSSSGDRREVRR